MKDLILAIVAIVSVVVFAIVNWNNTAIQAKNALKYNVPFGSW